MPLSSNTIFIPLGVLSSITIDCTCPPHVVARICGCEPPGCTFICFTLRASLASALWQLGWSNSHIFMSVEWIKLLGHLCCIFNVGHESLWCPIASYLVPYWITSCAIFGKSGTFAVIWDFSSLVSLRNPRYWSWRPFGIALYHGSVVCHPYPGLPFISVEYTLIMIEQHKLISNLSVWGWGCCMLIAAWRWWQVGILRWCSFSKILSWIEPHPLITVNVHSFLVRLRAKAQLVNHQVAVCRDNWHGTFACTVKVFYSPIAKWWRCHVGRTFRTHIAASR